MWLWFQKGGPVMYFILGCSIIAVAILLERIWQLYWAQVNTERFVKGITSALHNNKIKQAVDLCTETASPLANILKAGILKHDRPRVEIKEAIEDAGTQEIPKLEKNIEMLATIAHIAPLLGLLGTVTGMVRAFRVIEEKATLLQPVNPGDLAGGIWEALLTTVFGLIVAIPTYVAYNYLVSRVENIILDMERNSGDLINTLSQRER